MRRAGWSLGLAGLLGMGLAGCEVGGPSDPVAAAVAESGQQVTVEPSATAGSEAAVDYEKEQLKRQAEADRKARGGR